MLPVGLQLFYNKVDRKFDQCNYFDTYANSLPDNTDTKYNMKKYIVNTLSEYVKIIEDVHKGNDQLWFRGCSDASYRLEPGIVRYSKILHNNNNGIESQELLWNRYENFIALSFKRMLSQFKKKAFLYCKSCLPANDFEWMFLMQHYGIPTYLLDWTTNPLVALYFALPSSEFIDRYDTESLDISECIDIFKQCGYSEGGSSVYIIDPIGINDAIYKDARIFDISSEPEKWVRYIDHTRVNEVLFPLCTKTPFTIDSRVSNQNSVFTLHGLLKDPIDHYQKLRAYLYKIFIPYNAWFSLKKELSLFGITSSYIYPDLGGLAMEVKDDAYVHFLDQYAKN